MIDNKEIYCTVEFDAWVNRKNLNRAEKYLIKNYLDKKGRTLEAGTAGGKILLAMKELGFDSLTGFDYVPGFIESARRRDTSKTIRFDVADAVSLPYADSSFDQIIYLQQIICCIEDEPSRRNALQEAHRVLEPGGTALFSFLSFEVRRRSPAYMPFLAYLRLFRTVTRSNRTMQYIPWLRHGGRFHRGSLLDAGPCVYWYKLDEIYRALTSVGFTIVSMGSTAQIDEQKMVSYEELQKGPIRGMIFVVAKKD
jgi:ubiquinone/menaquinone biosynthesis C-methylase UbiE